MDSPIFFLIILIVIITYNGLRNYSFQEKYLFHVDRILIAKEYYRLISSGFLHGGWIHLAFNMLALASFGKFSWYILGAGGFSLLYMASLIGGNLLALYVHRNHGNYRALGASGAVFGVIFSSIVFNPFSRISFIFIPVGIPGWIMGIIFVLVSVWGIRKQTGNVGHEAHLGGAIIGMIVTALLRPDTLTSHPWIFALLGIPSIGFVLYTLKNPNFLVFDSFSSKSKPKYDRYEPSRAQQLDELLDKISALGYEKLTDAEKKRLKELSEK
ncbi:rhomboid family protein [Fulvivirga ligni]|uniref:rhomboid family protein n=1 Tax=Fulvivirga ligni TaxID=2904246 RepID=UPI001F3FF5B1|nr:rhomboid family intramembrane serine protease [Fulvivirga ligni]UII19128.1 rhomboid family intramembrane serine protease [Fulvivirga ligni]